VPDGFLLHRHMLLCRRSCHDQAATYPYWVDDTMMQMHHSCVGRFSEAVRRIY